MRDIVRIFPLILALMTGVALAHTIRRSFSFETNVAQQTLKPGDPAVVEVQLKNTSDHVIYRTILPGWDKHGELIGFPPILRDAEGKEPPLTKLGRLVFGRQTVEDTPSVLTLNEVGRVPMAPGEVMKTEIRLSDLYDLSLPGKYTVQVRYYDDENKEEVKSKAITVTVVP
jgi:hypothetical protein